jgi:pyruvate dehydrogenase E2 component (dihydrolipoamide acetyltransferase)
MAIPVFMPKLGLTMEEGTVTAWPKAPGERVEQGEIVLVIETEKTEAEIEASASGWVRHLYAAVGQKLPSGALLAALTETPDEPFDSASFAAQHAGDARKPVDRAARSGSSSAAGAPGARDRVIATPRARRLAHELGVDLASVRGSGPGGRVTDDDVRSAAAATGEAVRASAEGDLLDLGDGVALEVLVAGSGDDVLLVPGFGSDLSVFAPLVEALARERRVIGVHPRGTGRSTAPDRDRYRPEDGAADLEAVLARTSRAPAHVVAASLGAAAALELALVAPDRLATLTLVTPFASASARLRWVLDTWTELVRRADLELAARAIAPWLFSRRFLADTARSAAAVRGLARMMARTPAKALERWARGLEEWPGIHRERLQRLRTPVLLLRGDDDALLHGEELDGGSVPGARVEVIAGAGHALTLEAPAEVTRAIRGHRL